MRRSVMVRTAPLGLVALTLAACGGSADTDTAPEGGTETIELRFGDYLSDGHPTRENWSEPFVENLEEMAGDDFDVQVEYIGGGELVDATGTFDALQDGVVDMGSMVTNYIVEQVPVAGIAEVPGSLQDDAVQGSAALMRFLEEHAMDDFAEHNMRPVMAYALDPYNLVTVDKKLETPSDVAGMTIRGGGGALNEGLEALGASPVQMSVTDAYLALDRGVIDGTALGSVSITSYDLYDVADYSTSNLKVGSASLIYAVNQEWWEGLSPEAQDLVERAAAAVQESAPPAVHELEAASFAEAEEQGMEVYEVPDPAAWDAALQDVPDTWIAQMDDLGKDGEQLMQDWRTFLDEAEQN